MRCRVLPGCVLCRASLVRSAWDPRIELGPAPPGPPTSLTTGGRFCGRRRSAGREPVSRSLNPLSERAGPLNQCRVRVVLRQSKSIVMGCGAIVLGVFAVEIGGFTRSARAPPEPIDSCRPNSGGSPSIWSTSQSTAHADPRRSSRLPACFARSPAESNSFNCRGRVRSLGRRPCPQSNGTRRTRCTHR